MPELFGKYNLTNWADQNGDTPLIVLLSCSLAMQLDETLLTSIIDNLLDLGDEIHIGNREEETALAIASRKGQTHRLALAQMRRQYS